MNTHGTVTIEDGNPGEPNDFNPRRKVSVSFGFANEEDDGTAGQKFLDAAANAANAKVDELLGRKVKTQESPDRFAPSAETAKTSRKKATDKDKLAQAVGLPTEDVVTVKTPAVVEPAEDNIDDLLGDQAPVPITDAELAKAAQNKNAQMKVKDPNFSLKIRALVVEYAGTPPKKITDVPVAKRQEFIEKLRDLT